MSLMNAYSKDLRLKALAALERGVPRRELQDLFGLSRSTIKRWLKRRRLTGDVAIHKIAGRPVAPLLRTAPRGSPNQRPPPARHRTQQHREGPRQRSHCRAKESYLAI